MFNEAMIGMSAVYGRQIGCYVARDITTGCRAIATSPDIYTDSTLMRGAHRGNIPPPSSCYVCQMRNFCIAVAALMHSSHSRYIRLHQQRKVMGDDGFQK